MYQSDLTRDITTAVQRALRQHFDARPAVDGLQYSDELLRVLPAMRGAPPATTAMLLQRYQAPLQQALCRNHRPRQQGASIADQLDDLTRAVLMAVGTTEGLSIESAVGMALVLHRRGLASLCALPAVDGMS
jgi:hypothetical protein